MPETGQKPYTNIKENIYNDSLVSDVCNKEILIYELAELWLFDIENTMRPSSYALYQNYANKYILPYIGNIQASNFNAGILSQVLGSLRTGNIGKDGKEKSLSQYTVYLLESMVHAMFHYGADKKLIPEIPFGKAEFITVKKKEPLPLTVLEVQQLLYTTEKQGEDFKLQVMLPLYTGITLSELCGLKWEDVDLETGEIYIHRNLMRIQNNASINSNEKTDKLSTNLEVDSKTATVITECELPEYMCRKFTMPEKLSGLLKTVACAKKTKPENYVAELDKKAGRKRNAAIPENTPDGRTLQYRLKVAGDKAGIKGLTFKMLRDTFAVMCLQAGGDVYSLAYVMGTGIPALCERYGHWMVKNDRFLKILDK